MPSGRGQPASSVARGGLVLAVVGLTGLDVLRQETLEGAVTSELTRWLEPVEPTEVLDVAIDDDVVTVLVTSLERGVCASRVVVGRSRPSSVHPP